MTAGPLRLLYFCPWSRGGIADYAHAQATALTGLGAEVTVQAPPGFRGGGPAPYPVVRELEEPDPGAARGPRVVRRAQMAGMILRNVGRLDRRARAGGYRHVLLGSYIEYLAPLWAGRLRRLHRSGVRLAAVLHDPVRNYVVGPRWWHRWSVAEGYSFLTTAFVHEATDPVAAAIPPTVQVVTVPQGIYAFPPPARSRPQVRAGYGVPDAAPLLLSFGHMRDGKNLHLILRALADFPEVHLLVAGSPPGGGNRPLDYYQTLATELGVAARCHWRLGHVPEAEASDLFQACDLIALTYSRDFRSASAVLNVAAAYRKPCLASAGPGPLEAVVRQYGLGVWVEPDDGPAVRDGLGRWLRRSAPTPRWDDYHRDHSWERNAELVRQALLAPLPPDPPARTD